VLSEKEQKERALLLGRAYESNYFRYYKRHRKVFGKNPEKSKYWNRILKFISLLQKEGINNPAYYVEQVFKEFHSYFPKNKICTLYLVTSEKGIEFFQKSQRKVYIPSELNAITVEIDSEYIYNTLSKVDESIKENPVLRKLLKIKMGRDIFGED
jgi:hypothetical protein